MQLWTQETVGGTWKKKEIEPFPIPNGGTLAEVAMRYGITADEPQFDTWDNEPRRLIIFSESETEKLAVLGSETWGGSDPAYFFLLGFVLTCAESIPIDGKGGRETMPAVLYIEGEFPLTERTTTEGTQRLAIDLTGLVALDLRNADEAYREELDANPALRLN